MANKPRHRRFGNIRKRESGRYQIRYPGPDGRMRTGLQTYERKSDAERALSLIEAQMISGEWADSDRSKIKLQDYAAYWIAQRAGLRLRTVDLYSWLCRKHINPYLGGVPLGRLLHRGPGTQSVYVHSVTGYWVRFPISDLDRLLLATQVGGAPLSADHGFPARLVAPGRRGYWWVKWVDRIEVQTTPSWWQPPFPIG